MKNITILGSTGSIGVNALNILGNIELDFKISYLTANRNADLMIKQCKEFHPKAVIMIDEESAEKVYQEVSKEGIEVLVGRENLLDVVRDDTVDLVLNSLVGASGMEPTYNAINAGIDVALANKESLVVAGNIITKAMEKSGAKLYPVDSEHSAIWQCLVGESINDIEKIILTGSGGPFRTRDINTFKDIKVSDALKHPNWDMGKKITIDSATMMNKGLEVIEAYWLFNLSYSEIEIIIHPQSIVHSMVQFNDGSIKAQMGVPDMKIPIQYALTYPNHIKAPWKRLEFSKLNQLTFESPDLNKFPCIKLAYDSLEKLGSAPAVLTMVNDYCVYKFLDEKIKFTDIPIIIKHAVDRHAWVKDPDLKYLNELNTWSKNFVDSFV